MSSYHEERRISFRMVLRLFGLLGSHWRAYALVCGIGVIIACLEMIPPKLIGQAVNIMRDGAFEMKPIFIIAGIWSFIAIVVQAFHGIQIWLANGHGERVLAELRQRIFEQLQNLSMSFYDRTHAGRILTTTSSDIESVKNVLIWGLNTLLSNGAVMIMAALMILHTDWRLFLATAWLAPAMTALNFIYGKKVTEAWQVVRKHSSLVGANQAENIAGHRVVAAFNRQEQNLQHFNHLQDINTANNVMAARKSGLFNPMLQWVRFLGLAIILFYGGYRVTRWDLAPGDLVATMLYWDWFMQPAVNFGVFFNELLIAMSGAERIFALLDEKPDVADPPGATDLPRLRGDVKFENITFRYQENGRTVLKNVSFEIPAGSTVALVGETGSGKSTIISLLARFYRPNEGRILIDGYDIHQHTGKSLHKQMAMVLQVNYLFSGTVIENLRYARPDATDEEVYGAARRLGCHERFLAMKKGYDTPVGEKGSALSLGERQLVCFTRALIAEPTLLLLDEATSALDPITGLHVQRALKRLIDGRTAFIVTHRLSTIRNADIICVVENGEIREMGRHDELLAKGGAYARLYASSQRGATSSRRSRERDSEDDRFQTI